MEKEAERSEASRIASIMGLEDWQKVDDVRLVEIVSAGLPVSSVKFVIDKVDPLGCRIDAASFVPRSTKSRLRKQRKPLPLEYSEKTYALAKIYTEALRHYHDDDEAAQLFLSREHPMLGGHSPLDVAARSAAGADLVMKLLARAEASMPV